MVKSRVSPSGCNGRGATDIRLMSTDIRLLATDIRSLSTDIRLLATDIRLLSTDIRLLSTDIRLLSTDIRLLSTDIRLLSMDKCLMSNRRRQPVRSGFSQVDQASNGTSPGRCCGSNMRCWDMGAPPSLVPQPRDSPPRIRVVGIDPQDRLIALDGALLVALLGVLRGHPLPRCHRPRIQLDPLVEECK